jgi:aminoglycoside 3-N-acetyltransferase
VNVVQFVSGVARAHLGPAAWTTLRNGYLRVRDRAGPLIRAVQGSFTPAQFREHLEATLPRQWDILFVHSSVNGLQPMYRGGQLELLRTLIEFTGPDRTLAMPAFFFGDPAVGGAGETFARNPVFDLRRTPSQMGVLTEMFRRWPGALQSRNPVYRIAALGPLAKLLTSGHEHSTTLCGRGTPFATMAEHNALIVGIGKHYEVLTQVHHAEDVLGDAFPVPRSRPEPLPMTLIDGSERIEYALPLGGMEWRRDMWRLRTILPRGMIAEWSFRGAPMFATRAGDVSRALVEAALGGRTIYVRS